MSNPNNKPPLFGIVIGMPIALVLWAIAIWMIVKR